MGTKISALTELTALPAATDVFPVVTGVGGTPVTKRVQYSRIAQALVPWAGKVCAAYADGDPNVMLGMMNGHEVAPANATPTNISTSIARCSFFMLPFDLTVNTIRYFSLAAVSNCYEVAIYRYSTLARLTSALTFNTVGTNVWESVGSSLGIALSAGVVYFIAVSTRATGATSGVACFSIAGAANTPQRVVLPSNQPGNLDIDSVYVGGGYFGDFAVTTGALPDPAATLAVQSAWTGGMPAFFLDNA